MLVVGIVLKALLGVITLWWTTITIMNGFQGNEVPWWQVLIMSVLVVIWTYLEYYT